jgi:Family of unknown function (DUF6065)
MVLKMGTHVWKGCLITMANPSEAEAQSAYKLLAFPVTSLSPMRIVPAIAGRSPMNPSNASIADRHPGIRMANQAGWVLLNNQAIEVMWNGGRNQSDLRILAHNSTTGVNALSHLGFGILTWKLPFLFHIPSELDLRVRGPVNWHKDGVLPLEAIIEAQSRATEIFMSWRITKIGTPIRFEIGEPLCVLYPEQRGLIQRIEPEIHSLDEYPEFKAHTSGLNASVIPASAQASQIATIASGGKTPPAEGDGLHQSPSFKDLRPKSESEMRDSAKSELDGNAPPKLNRPQPENLPLATQDILGAPFHIESDFFGQAEALRAQFEKQASSGGALETGENPFRYMYMENAYQCITASADHVFTQDVLLTFVDRLRAWAREKLGASHASSPRIRIYVNGSRRVVVRDDINVKWHYLFSLTRSPSRKAARMKILLESTPGRTGSRLLNVGRIVSASLDFNQLLVHDVKMAYGIDAPKASMNPQEGNIILDGYLW